MYSHEATLTQTPVHVLGLVLRELDTLQSLGAAILAHPVLYAAFAEDPARITRDILDAQMSPATARLAYAAHAARSVDRTSTVAVKKFADDWLAPLDDAAAHAHAGSEGGPLGIWPWGLSLADVVSMSKAHGVVEDLTRQLVDTALPQCAGLFGTQRADYARATPAEVARIHRMLYGYEIYCGLLFRDAGDCKADLSWRTEVNFQLSAALYHDNVAKANNQLACIHDFLENIVMQGKHCAALSEIRTRLTGVVNLAFKQVAQYDVAWGAHEVDYLSTGSANEHVQAYVSNFLLYHTKSEMC